MPLVRKIAYVDLNKIERKLGKLGIEHKEVQKDEIVKKLSPFTKLINTIFKNFSKLFSKKINKDKIIKDKIISDLSLELGQIRAEVDKLEQPNTLESAEFRRYVFEIILDRCNRISKVFIKIKILPEKLSKEFKTFSQSIIDAIDEDKETIRELRPKYEQVIKMGKELDIELKKVGLKQPIDLEKAKTILEKHDEINTRLSEFIKSGSGGKPITGGKRFENALNSVTNKLEELDNKLEEIINNTIQIMESENRKIIDEMKKHISVNTKLYNENSLLMLRKNEKTLKINELKKESGNEAIIKKLEQNWKTRQTYITSNNNIINMNNNKRRSLMPEYLEIEQNISSYKKLL